MARRGRRAAGCASNDRVGHWIAAWSGEDRAARDASRSARALLRAAGASPLLRSSPGRAAFELAICEEPLEYPPRTQSIYSDLGSCCSASPRRRRRRAARSRSSIDWRDRELGRRRRAALPPAPRLARRASRRPRIDAVARRAAAAARCTTRTRRRSAASPATPDCSAPRRRSARCARVVAALRPSLCRAVRARTTRRRARQLARARLGHDAADLVVRHAAVAARDRPHRLHRHVAVDRSRA